MAQPIASVHVDIAEFLLEVTEVQGGDEALAAWVRRLSKCLSRRDPAMHEYGGRLLGEAARFQADAAEKKRRAAHVRWEKEHALHSGAMQGDAMHSGASSCNATDRADRQSRQSSKKIRSAQGGRSSGTAASERAGGAR